VSEPYSLFVETARKLREARRILEGVEATALGGVAQMLAETVESLARTARELKGIASDEWFTFEEAAGFLGLPYSGFREIAPQLPRHAITPARPKSAYPKGISARDHGTYYIPRRLNAAPTASSGEDATLTCSPNSQLSSATTGRPTFRARPISESVPYSPPTAMTTSPEQTTARFLACPVPVAME
jgi:hypothetical protein